MKPVDFFLLKTVFKHIIIIVFLLDARTLAAQSNDTLDVYFFKDINFSDTAVLSTDYFTNQILDYITYEQAQQPSGRQMWGVILGVDHVLQLSSENYQVYKHVYQFLIEGFSALGYNEAIDYMMRIPYFYTMNVTEQQIEEMESLAESYDRVKIGNKAPLIEGKTIYDDYFNINEIDTDFVVVLFWSYSCEHCRSIMRDMKKFLREHPDYALVALSIKGDIKKIRRLIAKNDLEGFFYHDGLDWEGKFVSAYAIDATPSMFVLDKNRIIVAKPFDMEELIEFTNN